MSSDPRERRAIDDNGPIFDTATNVPIEFSVKTRRNQAAVNNQLPPCRAPEMDTAVAVDSQRPSRVGWLSYVEREKGFEPREKERTST